MKRNDKLAGELAQYVIRKIDEEPPETDKGATATAAIALMVAVVAKVLGESVGEIIFKVVAAIPENVLVTDFGKTRAVEVFLGRSKMDETQN